MQAQMPQVPDSAQTGHTIQPQDDVPLSATRIITGIEAHAWLLLKPIRVQILQILLIPYGIAWDLILKPGMVLPGRQQLHLLPTTPLRALQLVAINVNLDSTQKMAEVPVSQIPEVVLSRDHQLLHKPGMEALGIAVSQARVSQTILSHPEVVLRTNKM